MAEYADQVLERKQDGRILTKSRRRYKDSSLDTEAAALRSLVKEFGDLPLARVTRGDAITWAEQRPAGVVHVAVALFNRALDEELLTGFNPFRGLGRRVEGRADEAPPTPDEFDRLVDGCAALGDYGPQLRNMLVFAAYTGMRPSELAGLEWTDIDLARQRVHVRRRLYRGRFDLPKSNQERTIALPPAARDALLAQPTRALPIVFANKSGGRLTAPTLSAYWRVVRAAAGLEHDFYLASKHYGVHLLFKAGVSTRGICTQMGWSEKAVDKLLATYGHADIAALEEIDALYSDANPTHSATDSGFLSGTEPVRPIPRLTAAIAPP